jgi:ACDE family multidrug resistance protein
VDPLQQTEQQKEENRSWWVVLLSISFIPLLMVLGNSMLIPVLPEIRSALNISQLQVSLLITLFSVPAGIVIPISGILSDRFGRKKVMIPSLLLYGAGGVLAGISSTAGSYLLMLTGRILQGIGAAGTAPIAMALVSDLYREERRSKALGILEASNGMGKVLSPIFGSLLALIVWYAVYFAFPVLVIPAVIALWIFVKEPQRTEAIPPIAQYKNHLVKIWKRQGKWMIVAFLAGAVTLFILFGVLFYLSDILEAIYRIDGILKGLILAIPLLAMSSTSYWTGGHIRQKTRRMRLFIAGGLFSISLAMAVIPFFSNTYVLLGLLVLIGIGSGLVLPSLNTLITSAVGSDERGIVTSLYGSVRFLGVAIGPPVFGLLENQRLLLFLGASIAAALTGALALKTIRQTGRLRGKGGQSRVLLRKKGLQPT